jgi:predicted DsbA family dithiol-disulfide isomerase
MHVTVYFDYTCPHSYRALRWLVRVLRAAGGFSLNWATFSLTEATRDRDQPSPFDDPGISSFSVLALALSHAAREADFGRFHFQVFEAIHGHNLKVREDELLQIASAAGIDVEAFNSNRSQWLNEVIREHREGALKWGVRGTPTLVIDEGTGVWVKLAEEPESKEQAVDLWRAIGTLSQSRPDLIEIKRPS